VIVVVAVLMVVMVIGVGAQSTLGDKARHFCLKNMSEKLAKFPNFFNDICPKD